MEVLRRCPLAIAQRLVHCAIALSTAVLDRVTKTMSVAPLLMNNLDNSKQKTSNLLSPAPPSLFWAKVRVQLHLPPLRSLDLLISPGALWCYMSDKLFIACFWISTEVVYSEYNPAGAGRHGWCHMKLLSFFTLLSFSLLLSYFFLFGCCLFLPKKKKTKV